MKSEVSITLRCQLCSTPLHSISNQELHNPRIPKERNCTVCPNHINYRLKSEVSSTLRCRLCSTPLHSISNQELHNPRIPKERNCTVCPNHINYRLKSEVSITLRCRLCSTRYTAVRIKNCLKSTSAYQNSHDEKYGRFPFRREAITFSRQIDTFPCQQR